MDNNTYYSKLSEFLARGESIWQASIVETDGSSPAKSGMKLAVLLSENPFGNLGGGALEHKVIEYIVQSQPNTAQSYTFSLAEDGSSAEINTGMICGGIAKVFIEPLHLAEKLFVIGAGHCGKALGHVAKLCGFQVCLIDNRSEIIETLPAETFHKAVLSDYSNLNKDIDFTKQSWVVIMTHGHIHDKEVLEQCLRKPLKYLGMIGSKNKVAQTFAKLSAKGFTAEELAHCHAPIGMPIASQTPYEIAVSILAEMIAIRNRKPD